MPAKVVQTTNPLNGSIFFFLHCTKASNGINEYALLYCQVLKWVSLGGTRGRNGEGVGGWVGGVTGGRGGNEWGGGGGGGNKYACP